VSGRRRYHITAKVKSNGYSRIITVLIASVKKYASRNYSELGDAPWRKRLTPRAWPVLA